MRQRFCLMVGAWLLGAFAASAQDIRVPTDESFHALVSNLPACSDDPDRVHVRLGRASASPARSEALAFVPHDLNVTGHVDRPGEMTMNLPARSGCPDQPIEAMILVLAPDEIFPLGLSLAAGEAGPNRQMAAMRDGGRCPRLADTFTCAGQFPGPDGPVAVTAVIAADPSAVGRDSLPLFQICEKREPRGFTCESSGFRHGVTFKTAVEVDDFPSVALMRAVESAVDETLAQISFRLAGSSIPPP